MFYFICVPGKCQWCKGDLVQTSWGGRVICYAACAWEAKEKAWQNFHQNSEREDYLRDAVTWNRRAQREDQRDLLGM